MTDFLIPMLFGWPMTILALSCVLAGILFSRWKLTLLGGIFFLPPTWYIGFYFSYAFILPLFLFACAYFVAKNKTLVASLLLVPVLALTAWLAFLVITQ